MTAKQCVGFREEFNPSYALTATVMEVATPPMRFSHRIMFCLLSNLVAVAVAALFGAGLPAPKLLHQWYPGVLVSFVAILTVLMSVTFRRGRETSLWTVPTSAALSYPAAALAYVSYFSLFEPERFANTFGRLESATGPFVSTKALDLVVVILFVMPTISFSWLFGITSGAAFCLFSQAARLLKQAKREPRGA